MPKRLLRLPKATLAVLTFVGAAVIMFAVAFAAALVIEQRSTDLISQRLKDARIEWANVSADGLQLRLQGTAPNEAARFRALNLVGRLVDSSRLHDELEVTPTNAVAAPRFSVEMLRNDDGIQLIGLMPAEATEGALGEQDFLAQVAALGNGAEPTDMLQTAQWPAPAQWDPALRYGLKALGLLKRAKISVSAGRVEVTAIAESASEKSRLEAALERQKPRDLALVMKISAPRPVITPFTLRFLKDEAGVRFDACSADTERARREILAAAERAGLAPSAASCVIGIGAPSPRWSSAVAAGIRAVDAMAEGAITFSDTDVTLTAGPGTKLEDFDTALGDLRARLPDSFSLQGIAPKADQLVQGPTEFIARRARDGQVTLRGRLVDAPQQSAVSAFARAAFGAQKVQDYVRLDPDLPDGWPVRVLAGLESLSLLVEGSVQVLPDMVTIEGVSGAQETRGRITRILSSRLGQGQDFRIDVRYDIKLDPLAGLPTPQECVQQLADVLAREKIVFPPGSAEISHEASGVVDALAEILRKCTGLPLEIAGHTDSQGSDAGNLALSQARAEAVRMALEGRRIDTSAMQAKGYGEAAPIADNRTELGREANRRIEFVLRADALPDMPPPAPAQGTIARPPITEGTGPEDAAPDADPDAAAEPEADAFDMIFDEDSGPMGDFDSLDDLPDTPEPDAPEPDAPAAEEAQAGDPASAPPAAGAAETATPPTDSAAAPAAAAAPAEPPVPPEMVAGPDTPRPKMRPTPAPPRAN